MEHANWFTLTMELIFCGAILYKILAARRGRKPFIRRIPGLLAVDEAVGRATEMGRPILFSIGLGGLDITTLQALSIAGYVARLAARYGNRVIIPVVDSAIYPVAEEVLKDSYNAEGRPELFNGEDVRFLSGSQFAYASGVVGIINREKVASSFMFGYFAAESLILAEAGQTVGAIQVAGTDQLLQVPFFIAACDYVVIGEEFFAASAYLSQEPTLLGSLVGQDYAKILIALAILAGAVIASVMPGWIPKITDFMTMPGL
ncbi:MAG: hypothetical protein IT210_13160 [Armatimonadetes bacterium]|nr:hypothetical protein [Armatimonadota bacterium]